MAIIIQGCTVVVRNAAIQLRYPDGLEGYRRDCPNKMYYSDGTVSAVSFMMSDDGVRFTRLLANYGFADPLQGPSSEVAVAIGTGAGEFLGSCEWLCLDRLPLPDDRGGAVEVLIARLKDEVPTTATAPADWLSMARAQPVTREELDREYDLIAETPSGRGRVFSYRHRTTQQVIHIGRPDIPGLVDQVELTKMVREFGELEKMPISRERDRRLASFYDECTRLVEASGGTEPSWVQLQGAGARLAGRWKMAEAAFRRLTELRPEYAVGWMDLTWVLAHEDRLEEAEVAAREAVKLEPNNPHAHGNLANVLNQQGMIESALQAVTRAMEIDPANEAYRIMRQRLLSDVSERVEQSQVDSAAKCEEGGAPWYKRLLRRG